MFGWLKKRLFGWIERYPNFPNLWREMIFLK